MAKKLATRLKEAAKALVTPEPEVFRSANKVVKCAHCGGLRFVKRAVSLNSAASELVGAAFLDKQACALVCAKCSRIEWFYESLVGAEE